MSTKEAQQISVKNVHPNQEPTPLTPAQPKTSSSFAAWQATSLRLVVAYLFFEATSGFILYFAKPFLSEQAQRQSVEMHVLLGLLLLPFYATYQWSHWKRVQKLQEQLSFKLGFVAFLSILVIIFSGIYLSFGESESSTFQISDLLHIVFGAALAIALCAHFALVMRKALDPRKSNRKSALSIYATVYWIPLISTLCLLLITYLYI